MILWNVFLPLLMFKTLQVGWCIFLLPWVLSVSQRCKVNLRRSRWSAPARSSNAWALANHIAGRCQDLPVVFFTTQEPLQTWRDQYYRTCSSLGLWFNDGGICFGRWWNLILARLCVTSHIIFANSVAAARKRERERSGKSYNWSYTAIFCDSYIIWTVPCQTVNKTSDMKPESVVAW